jgi:hypothetical protein
MVGHDHELFITWGDNKGLGFFPAKSLGAKNQSKQAR